MTGVLFAAIVLVAAGVWVARGVRARAARARSRSGPGSSLETAIPIRSFEDIDAMVTTRRCHCGRRVRPTGEGTREAGARRYRFARLACDECEEETMLHFDVTDLLH
jgi:hypothetical protein